MSTCGAALAVRQGANHSLTALVERLPRAAQRAAELACIAVPACFLLVLLVTGIEEMIQADLQDAATLPLRMLLPYAALPVGAALMRFHLVLRALGFVEARAWREVARRYADGLRAFYAAGLQRRGG